MLPGSNIYPDSMLPERSASKSGTWFAWNAKGAHLVLSSAPTYVNDAGECRIILSNGAAAGIVGTLRERLLDLIKEGFSIEVMGLSLDARIVPWTGCSTDHDRVDLIVVRRQGMPSAASEAAERRRSA